MSDKLKNVLTLTMAGVLALLFLTAGATKILGTEMQIKHLKGAGFPLWYRFPIGLTELVLALGMLWPKYRKWFCYGIFAWTAAALLTRINAGQVNMHMSASIVFSLMAALILFLSGGHKANGKQTSKNWPL